MLSGIASNCSAVVNATEKFAVPALLPAIIPAVTVGGAVLLHGSFGIWALVFATVAGSLIYACLTVIMMRSSGYQFQLRWHKGDNAARQVARQFGPVLLSSVVASGGLILDQAMAAMLPPGSVSALVFANRFVSVVIMLLAGAVSSAIVPYLSKMIAVRDWSGCRATIRSWAWISAAVSIPIALLLIAGAHFLVRVTLQHGAFGSSDTAIVTPVLAMYAIQIPFFVVSRVFYRFVVAMRRTDLILYCGTVNLVLDAILNLVLMRVMGVAGIALATSLWTISTLAFLWFWANRLLSNAAREGSGFSGIEVAETATGVAGTESGL